MFRFRLHSDQVQVELIANGSTTRLPFQVVGPPTEVAFLEELIEDHFGSLTVPPGQLFQFLGHDPWVQGVFKPPQLLEGDLDAATNQPAPFGFHRQTLGSKLVQAGVLELEELEQLLEDYRPFAETQRFGEFLRLNLQVPPQILDLLLNPALFSEQGLNEKRLGERLLELGVINREQLDEALAEHDQSGARIGEILAARGLISPTMARFFSQVTLNEEGQLHYDAS